MEQKRENSIESIVEFLLNELKERWQYSSGGFHSVEFSRDNLIEMKKELYQIALNKEDKVEKQMISASFTQIVEITKKSYILMRVIKKVTNGLEFRRNKEKENVTLYFDDEEWDILKEVIFSK